MLDETGFIKKGLRSVGVKRQYSGTAGRIENCQIGVFLGYASRCGRVLIDRALYLPEEWASDDERRCVAGVPGDIVFATKPKLGRAMLERAVAAGVPCRWVAADSVYGGDYALRLWLESHPLGYVLTVTSKQRAPMGFDTVKDRAGTLVRRSLSEPDKLTYYLTFAPDATPIDNLVQVAGSRWTIESCFEAAKGEVGLDQYEVRSWTGWHRHVTLAMLALAFLTTVRAAAIGGEGRLDLIADLLPLTVPEIRTLLAALIGPPLPSTSDVIAWSVWRRRHQQRARRSHWKRRTQTDRDRL